VVLWSGQNQQARYIHVLNVLGVYVRDDFYRGVRRGNDNGKSVMRRHDALIAASDCRGRDRWAGRGTRCQL